MPMWCVIMQHTCFVFASQTRACSHSHLNSDLGLYCYSLVDRGGEQAAFPPLISVRQTSSGMLVAFLSVLTAMSIAFLNRQGGEITAQPGKIKERSHCPVHQVLNTFVDFKMTSYSNIAFIVIFILNFKKMNKGNVWYHSYRHINKSSLTV